MRKNIEVNIPEWFKQDELFVLNTVVDEENEAIGVLFASDNFEQTRPYNPVVRVYSIRLNNGQYELEREISAFSFKSKAEAIAFSKNVVSYSATELLLDIHKNQVKAVI
ncbi:hypothetical protein U5N28_17815 [Lysinibacillus telephonicus]|uniref:Uncharacterized protein n=1 Tax=Lysinibacillus telephonicus TaxID=1714840 RepID=A0A3S0JTY6_9BACI|nr:hypothetical protein [Lysinibacillus telephonicus]RTQ95621.1 hypothetical protein EKG35_02755 [Lysinibacillus telephonicus]